MNYDAWRDEEWLSVDELGHPLHPLEVEGRRYLLREFRELSRPPFQPLPSGVLYRDKRNRSALSDAPPPTAQEP